MKTKIFCDIADFETIKFFNKKSIVDGFTTNPSLMRKAGAKDYSYYSKKIIQITKKPISLEVFADDEKDMIFQGNDGGSTVTALTLDMSAAGAATFNNAVDATNFKVNGAQGSDGPSVLATASSNPGRIISEVWISDFISSISSSIDSGIDSGLAKTEFSLRT